MMERGQSTIGLWAWALYDWANSAFPTVIQTFVFAVYFKQRVSSEEIGSAQWGVTTSLAGLIVALFGPVLGSIADRIGRRKPWIGGFTLLCVTAAAGLWWVLPSSEHVVLGLTLVIVGTVGSEGASMFYNAMLPSLAPADRMGRWSGWGWGLGYAGGLACLAIALFGLVRPEPPPFGLDGESYEPVRATFVLVAVWYAVFSLPLFLLTPDAEATGLSLREAVRAGWAQLKSSARKAKQYGFIIRFLLARMLYIDGLTTLFIFGGLYAADTVGMDEEAILGFGIAMNIMAGIGAVGFAWLDDWLGSKKTIVLALIGLIVPSALILFVGSVAWFWGLGLTLGIFVGPVQAASRTYMGRIAPPELANEMFGLYALSGKMTSFLGPLLVGWLSYALGGRIGMAIIPLLLLSGLLVLLTVREA